MPSLTLSSSGTSQQSILPDLKPKSPRRFFTFSPLGSITSPPVPKLPSPGSSGHTPQSSVSSSASYALGGGAQVVRTPSEARRGMKHQHLITRPSLSPTTEGLPRPPSRSYFHNSASRSTPAQMYANGYGKYDDIPVPPVPATAPIRTRPSQTSLRRLSKKPSIDVNLDLDLGPSLSASLLEKRHTARMSISPATPISAPGLSSAGAPTPAQTPSIAAAHRAGITDGSPNLSRRLTAAPPPRAPLPPTPFSAILKNKITRTAADEHSVVLVNLEFAYSSDVPANNARVTLPLEVLQRGGASSNLVRLVEETLKADAEGEDGPGMTDGSSADESELESDPDADAGADELDNLLRSVPLSHFLRRQVLMSRDEYFKSLWVSSPTELAHQYDEVPPVPPVPVRSKDRPSPTAEPGTTKRAVKRNQYTQLTKFPSPSSSYTLQTNLPLNTLSIQSRRAYAPRSPLKLAKPKGTITEVTVLLLRDAALYHAIAQRLINGRFGPLDGRRRKVEEECEWLGMRKLAEELVRGKSMVLHGGEGYI